ncbi:magnesium protoporphyrin IX methyltransferase [Gemmatimonas sp.]|jgi:magnesium-protoporphyrin O-methyltransferase|uniref:magnesium protoporphyrin IX methyltransferase n=2 Tax=Gemmatimonas sp. TaxID=1962908 RepID=UPI0022BEDCE5|nr:magnesium protoporphyrin IX methyltransferase [Gemmatimonas sp.]MCA2984811.1 magnesium protoporphyrin IX methyltransferase [Gemmatimonas sp.]MCA2987052.1 magnesium protoporphyrin IX methyltransferase [Gemmatimonas sp.]MCZ8012610.1 magnesium protoporphyrin IX methyltransferase [Gemmatimonas sp.]MCZ8268415.1 magnesium protoporphyrin IX methyltransferase [Gemmatimonas sp.]
MAPTVNNSPTPGPSFEGTPLGGSHAASVSYRERRAWIGEYFDRTAADAWKALTSDAPVSRVRATVRAGRDRMRHTLLTWLPPDLHGKRVLDAGCGTGTASIELAQRGAEVVAIDLSPTLVQHAQERAEEVGIDDIDFRSGDMLDPSLGHFDYVVAMDSIIHYELEDMVKALATLAPRVNERMLITVAPRTPMLTVMRAVGKLFPRSDRSPSIVPVSENAFRKALAAEPVLDSWGMVGTRLIESGFYRSMAINLQHATLGAHGTRRG